MANHVLNIEDFLEKCNEKIKSNRINLVFWSFTNNFEKLHNDEISFDDLNKKYLDIFIEICNNRLERSRAFLNDISVVLGFDFIALSIIATLAKKDETILSLIKKSDDLIFQFITIFLIAILIFLFILLTHYRAQVHAWTVFKEKTILMKKPLEK